ncbi:uncharacterized protein LOC110850081 isoform X2 [Folsomia candida]|uniref:uncharacterized protein LOC110850081 isoform X2 n=1 Tax=Folsomia candida TaxID=158441 RepID=UPI000B8FED44|nr:uncharacterized protein LOC110850081 isoform X2 [Folsomia candida]XP_021953256.1 uncharacterized protein LOC110850081 isoform X2 [Folsomia candida]
MGQFSATYFLILCIVHTSLAASRFRAEKYTVTFDEDLDAEMEQQSEGSFTPSKSHLSPANNQLFEAFQPITDAIPFPKRKLGQNPEWVKGSDGEIADFAYSAGYLHKDNFVARAVYNNSLIPGKISSGQKAVYIGVGTKEVAVSSYETLGSSPSYLCWIWPEFLPASTPVEGGHDENGNPIHVGRTGDQEILGAFYPSRGELVTTSNGHTNVERNPKNINILVWSWSVFPNCGW